MIFTISFAAFGSRFGPYKKRSCWWGKNKGLPVSCLSLQFQRLRGEWRSRSNVARLLGKTRTRDLFRLATSFRSWRMSLRWTADGETKKPSHPAESMSSMAVKWCTSIDCFVVRRGRIGLGFVFLGRRWGRLGKGLLVLSRKTAWRPLSVPAREGMISVRLGLKSCVKKTGMPEGALTSLVGAVKFIFCLVVASPASGFPERLQLIAGYLNIASAMNRSFWITKFLW